VDRKKIAIPIVSLVLLAQGSKSEQRDFYDPVDAITLGAITAACSRHACRPTFLQNTHPTDQKIIQKPRRSVLQITL
jgi:hypothetical protein